MIWKYLFRVNKMLCPPSYARLAERLAVHQKESVNF